MKHMKIIKDTQEGLQKSGKSAQIRQVWELFKQKNKQHDGEGRTMILSMTPRDAHSLINLLTESLKNTKLF